MNRENESMPSEMERARRLAEHLASRPPLLGKIEPVAGSTYREHLRAKFGHDGAAKIIRRAFDLAERKR